MEGPALQLVGMERPEGRSELARHCLLAALEGMPLAVPLVVVGAARLAQGPPEPMAAAKRLARLLPEAGMAGLAAPELELGRPAVRLVVVVAALGPRTAARGLAPMASAC